MEKRIFLSGKKFQELTLELYRLKNVEFPKNRKEMRAAMEGGGGMHDNAGYDSAAMQEALILSKIAELEGILAQAEILQLPSIRDRVGIGARVKYQNLEENEESEFLIAGAFETDLTKNTISYQSPLAEGLMGKAVGEIVVVRLPQKTMRLRITAIDWPNVKIK